VHAQNVARAMSTFRHDDVDARARCVVKKNTTSARAGNATTTGGRERDEW
jgi:hypothetical protein